MKKNAKKICACAISQINAARRTIYRYTTKNRFLTTQTTIFAK